MARRNDDRWVGSDKVVIQTDSEGTEFYVVDLMYNKAVRVVGGDLRNHGLPGGLTTLGSVIYAIGTPGIGLSESLGLARRKEEGKEEEEEEGHFNKGASFLDLAAGGLQGGSSGWKDVPGKMINTERDFPSCVSLGSKIFAFGNTFSEDGRNIWASGEFYDTNKQRSVWKAIPLPPISDGEHQLYQSRRVIVDAKNNRILVYFSLEESLYAYYPDRQERGLQPWLCVDNNLIYWDGLPASSVVDGVVYFVISSDELMTFDITGYDIQSKQRIQTAWSSLSPFGPAQLGDHCFNDLLHLGDGILCVYYYTYHTYSTLYTFYRIKACRVSPLHVHFTPLSTHTISLPGIASSCNVVAL